ncbi:hypothetical protein LLEC1_03222 [Akanthomyces lecanii]|uniref:DUF899 domain-containing protein n=1 Tax=Cordyceps confragosa TaxID=2714763 RepID=A0A179I6I1_CORDF|nr:hypothetical protein LLEC1_03222 [Akanthomyces lecanii]
MPAKIVSQREWIEASKALLEKEKELMRAADALSAARRELPMVRVDKDYTFSSAGGATVRSLADLFDGMDQLIVYHFMFGPDEERGCSGCAHVAGAPPDLEGFAAKCGWTFPWYSTAANTGNEFNRDFYVSIDQQAQADGAAPGGLFNFRSKEEMEALGKTPYSGEYFGFSVFTKNEAGEVFHTYSTYGRGVERVSSIFALLDITPLGRQDEPGGPGAFKLKYEYERDA